jgi:hypothetical protein
MQSFIEIAWLIALIRLAMVPSAMIAQKERPQGLHMEQPNDPIRATEIS